MNDDEPLLSQFLYSSSFPANSYIVFVPFESGDNSDSGIVYAWIGSKSSSEETRLIQEIAEDMFNNPWVTLQVKYRSINRTCIFIPNR